MGEVLRNSISVTAASNWLFCGHYSFRFSSYGWRKVGWSCNHSLDFRLSIKPKRRRVGEGNTKIEPLSVVSTPTMHFRDRSIRLDGSFDGRYTVASIETPVVGRNGEESKLLLRGQDIGSLEETSSNSGNSLIHQTLDVERGCESGVSRRENSEDMIIENKSRLHFLEERDEQILSKRLLALGRMNKVRSALDLFGSMKFSGLRPNAHACNSLLSCLLRNGHLDSALNVFEFMRTTKIVTGHTYSLLLKATASSKGCGFALDMFAELERDSKEIEDFDVVVYNTMISICGRMNNSYEAERIWRSMKENGRIGTEVTYSLLVSIFVRCGRNELALDAYKEMVQIKLTPRVDAMHAILSACTKEGKWDLALKVFQNMLNEGLKPNLTACNAVINSLGKAGKVELVFKVYGITKSLGHVPDEYTWNGLLTALYRADRYADTLWLFNAIRSENCYNLNEQLYKTALISCQKLGSWERAVQLLWQMEGSGLSVSTSSYNLVIGACEVARKPKAALQVYKHMVHRECPPDTFTHLSLIRTCIWGSLWDEVEEILNRVAPDASLYNAAIHGMCLRREFKSAKKLYMRMREMGLKSDGKTRALMLQNLRKDSN